MRTALWCMGFLLFAFSALVFERAPHLSSPSRLVFPVGLTCRITIYAKHFIPSFVHKGCLDCFAKCFPHESFTANSPALWVSAGKTTLLTANTRQHLDQLSTISCLLYGSNTLFLLPIESASISTFIAMRCTRRFTLHSRSLLSSRRSFVYSLGPNVE